MKQIFSLLAASLLLFSCLPENGPIEHPRISVDPVKIEAPYTASVFDVKVSSNTDSVLSRMDEEGATIDWVRVTSLGAKGDKEMQIKVLTNPGTTSRTAILTFKAGTSVAYLDVHQAENTAPPVEPEPDGYGFPMVQRFTTGVGVDVTSGKVVSYDFNDRPIADAKIKDGKVKFTLGLEIEAVNDNGSPVTYTTVQPAHTNPTKLAGFQEGLRLDGFDIGKITYSILFNMPVSGKVRFFKGQRRETGDSYEWSSDGGSSWTAVGAASAGVSDASWKYLDFEIPKSQEVAAGKRLLIRESVKYNASATYGGIIMGCGIALVPQEGDPSGVPAPDKESVIFSEGFDGIAGAPAAMVLPYGFMNSWTSGKHNSPSYAPASNLVTATNCYSRPGFLQIGFADEALAFGSTDVYHAGSLEINAGSRLAEMGKTDVELEVSFRACGITTAFEEPCNAAPVLTATKGTVTGECKLAMDEWKSYTFKVAHADATTVLKLESNSEEKGARVGKSDNRFFVDDIVIKITGTAPKPETVDLSFDFTGEPQAGWPTADKWSCDTLVTKHIFKLSGEDYTFVLADPQNADKTARRSGWTATGITMYNAYRFLGLPVIAGYRLAKVDCVQGTTPKSSREGGITTAVVPTTDDFTFVAGGEAKAWDTDSVSYTLTGTEPGKLYYLTCVKGGIGTKVLTLHYELAK